MSIDLKFLDEIIRSTVQRRLESLEKGIPDDAVINLEMPVFHLRRLAESLNRHEELLQSLEAASADYHNVLDLLGVKNIADVPDLIAAKHAEIERLRKEICRDR